MTDMLLTHTNGSTKKASIFEEIGSERANAQPALNHVFNRRSKLPPPPFCRLGPRVVGENISFVHALLFFFVSSLLTMQDQGIAAWHTVLKICCVPPGNSLNGVVQVRISNFAGVHGMRTMGEWIFLTSDMADGVVDCIALGDVERRVALPWCVFVVGLSVRNQIVSTHRLL